MQPLIREQVRPTVRERISVSFKHLAPSGPAVGQYNGIAVNAYGVLPGETALITVAKHSRGILLGDVIQITDPHPARRVVHEDHARFCSPWQIMEYPLQAEIKEGWITELVNTPDVFFAAPQEFGYRTKIEYGFMKHKGELTFSLRGHTTQIPVPSLCRLASPQMNEAALEILQTLRRSEIDASFLRSLVVRESKTNGSIIAVLYLRAVTTIPLRLADLSQLAGLTIAVAIPNVSTGIPAQVLRQEGHSYIEETIHGLTIRYPFDAFWQTNTSLFNKALQTIQDIVPEGSSLCELYAGTGVIGLSLHSKNVNVQGYEHSAAMVRAAADNATRNGILGATFTQLSDEAFGLRHLVKRDGLLVDPPRKGLSPQVHKMIDIHPPEFLIYLGCNIATLARDIRQLLKHYNITHVSGYDFYPNTPYVETLVKLERKTDL
ncbi:MAG: hypothetical protein WD200_00440 [Candidatus Andersenbacteria bacterium]